MIEPEELLRVMSSAKDVAVVVFSTMDLPLLRKILADEFMRYVACRRTARGIP